MRTTIDLPPRLLAAAKRIAAERATTLSAVVNDALGAYLGAAQVRASDKPFELLVRGRPGARFPTPAEIAESTDDEDRDALGIPGVSRHVAP
jgi:hypothetical protein